MVLVKKLTFFHLFISGKIGQENELHDMVEGKNAFLDYKKEKLKKSKKIGIFPKGLVHGCGQKLELFPSFYFRQNRPRK